MNEEVCQTYLIFVVRIPWILLATFNLPSQLAPLRFPAPVLPEIWASQKHLFNSCRSDPIRKHSQVKFCSKDSKYRIRNDRYVHFWSHTKLVVSQSFQPSPLFRIQKGFNTFKMRSVFVLISTPSFSLQGSIQIFWTWHNYTYCNCLPTRWVFWRNKLSTCQMGIQFGNSIWESSGRKLPISFNKPGCSVSLGTILTISSWYEGWMKQSMHNTYTSNAWINEYIHVCIALSCLALQYSTAN